MSDEQEQPVRRVGRKDRKRRLDSRQPLFPEGEEFAPQDLESETESDDAALEPKSVADESSRPVGERVETPPEARFPPLEPQPDEPVQPRTAAPVRQRRPNWLYNILTLLFVLASIALLAAFALIWVNPYHAINPLPPYTPLPIIITATPLPPTLTPAPTQTESPTMTPVGAVSDLAATPTAEIASFAFALAELDIDYAASEAGCDWLGIAGTVTDAQGDGVDDLTVRVRGQEDDTDLTSITGSSEAYGPGGFELQLGDTPQLAPYTIQLFDTDGTALSQEYLIVTSDACDQNVVVVAFVPGG